VTVFRYLLALWVLLLTAMAAAAPSHVAWTRRAIAELPLFHEDREAPGKAEQLDEIAGLVADSKPPEGWTRREWASLLLTIARHESQLSLRIQAGNCKPRECDHGKAAGLWQQHEFSWNEAVWEALPGNLPLQVQVAGESLRRAFLTCKGAKVPRVQATMSAYAGQGCAAEWKGLDERLKTFAKLMAVKQPGAES
jgi:hypothetical protein